MAKSKKEPTIVVEPQGKIPIIRQQMNGIDFSTWLREVSDNPSSDIFICVGSFIDRAWIRNTEFIFPKRVANGDYYAFKYGWLYRAVEGDTKRYIEKNGIVALTPTRARVQNNHFTKFTSRLCTLDLDHAYWRIAYIRGYISEDVYFKGLNLPDEAKSFRLSTLSVLGRSKAYRKWQDGHFVDGQVKVVKAANPELQILYKNIRYECYGHMHNLMEMLGDDFLNYDIDAITFVDSRSNKKRVNKYLNDNQLLFGYYVEEKNKG